MMSRERVTVRAGAGVEDDRYAARAGFWQDDRVSRDLTLIEAEVIDELVAGGLAIEPGELRRTLTTRGIRLDDLLGRLFWVGDVLARGTGLCEPCRHLEDVTGKPLLRLLVHRGGLRADALAGGAVVVGGPVEAVEEQKGVGALVVRDGRVLLGRRSSAHGNGTWSFPGGKPLPGESAVDCALRELEEETGLRGDRGAQVAETLDGFPESRLVFRPAFVLVADAAGEPAPREPEKTGAWRWYSWGDLPAPLFRPVASFAALGVDLGV
jgi:8-oxo-dGTP pyrophosphatase MutT (NUDIX family)